MKVADEFKIGSTGRAYPEAVLSCVAPATPQLARSRTKLRTVSTHTQTVGLVTCSPLFEARVRAAITGSALSTRAPQVHLRVRLVDPTGSATTDSCVCHCPDRLHRSHFWNDQVPTVTDWDPHEHRAAVRVHVLSDRNVQRL